MRFLVLLLAAVTLGCASSNPRVEVIHVTPALLPLVPAEVTSALGPVTVEWADSLKNGEGVLVLGGWNYHTRTILLSREIKNETVAWHTLLHEKCHVWFWDSGLFMLISPRMQQTICDLTATSEVAGMLKGKYKK